MKPRSFAAALVVLAACQQSPAPVEPTTPVPAAPKRWLAGDHHIHSHYSVKWDNSVFPPKPILGGDAKYSIPLNAQMAAHYGLDWLVITDHGGPNRAQLALEKAYPELLASRQALPQILQFYGMEFDVPGNAPGGRHASFIMPYRPDAVVNALAPNHPNEAEQLFQIERTYNGRQGVPPGPEKAQDSYMLEALRAMAALPDPPLVLANHPARLAKGFRQYFKITPAQLRDWQDSAPNVMIGMTAAEGHQAATLNADGSRKADGIRGEYPDFATMGGYDQMTARLGGVWDSLLSEGRRFWITGVSDSHGHYTDGWADFWPGQYAKTYVQAAKDYDSIFAALKAGKIFVTTGDLVDELDISVRAVSASNASSSSSDVVARDGVASDGAGSDKISASQSQNQSQSAGVGERLQVTKGSTVLITVRARVPKSLNGDGQRPQLARLDLIAGDITGNVANRNQDDAPQTRILQRAYTPNLRSWQDAQGTYVELEYRLENLQRSGYVRVRGTNNAEELEPQVDAKGEDPWGDLWCYSNPVFVEVY